MDQRPAMSKLSRTATDISFKTTNHAQTLKASNPNFHPSLSRPLCLLRLPLQRLAIRQKPALRQLIEAIILPIQAPKRPPKRNPAKEGEDRNRHVQPHEQRVRGQRHKRLRNRRREGVREPEDARDERPHVLGRFGVGVFKARDGREDFGEGDEDVCLKEG